MIRGAFFEVADQVWCWVDSLLRQTRSSLIEAEDQLCRQPPSLVAQVTGETIVAMALADIGARLEEVLAAYDVLRSADGRHLFPWKPRTALVKIVP